MDAVRRVLRIIDFDMLDGLPVAIRFGEYGNLDVVDDSDRQGWFGYRFFHALALGQAAQHDYYFG